MDIIRLAQCLKLSADNKERKDNEEYIDQAKTKENYGPALLNIACDGQYQKDVQLSAGIQLKNYINSNWKFGSDKNLNNQLIFDEQEPIIVIKQEDKDYLKFHIIDALVYSTTHVKLMKQLNQCIKKICRLSFENWKEYFMNKIIELFKSGEDNKIFGGILAFYQLSKIFEFESGEYKVSYNKAFEIMNPYLLTFLNGLITKIDSPEAAIIVYKIFKIFYKNLQMDINPLIMEEKNFENWNLFIITIKRHKLPDNLLIKTEKPSDISELDKNIFWKLKRLCYTITYRIYSKYGSLVLFDKNQPHLINFSNLIQNKYLKLYFEVYIEALLKSKVEFVSEHIISLVYKLLSNMLTRYHLVEEIEKILKMILTDHIVQDSMFSVKDFELWKNDPKEYINKQFDMIDGHFSKRYCVAQFIQKVCVFKKKNLNGKLEKKAAYYQDCFNYLVSILEMYEDNLSKGVDVDVRIKESVLFIIESMSEIVIRNSKKNVEKMIELFVLKEFDSSIGIMRERACTFVENFSDLKFTNADLSQEITKKICNILDTETELPVKVMAAICAPLLLKHPGVKDLLAGSVSKLLEIYLNLINTVDLEEILGGLESIIASFSHQITDYAVPLCFELIKHFKKLVQTQEESDDPKAETFIVIDAVMRTLLKIIELFVNNDQIFSQIESPISEIIHWGLKPENFEKLDDTLDIINILLKKANRVTTVTWSYFPHIVFSLVGTDEEYADYVSKYPNQEYEGLGYESISDITSILILYISKDPDTFLNGVDSFNIPYYKRTISLVQRIISLAKKSKDNLQNYKYALKILNVIIDSQKGKIDSIVREVLVFLVNELNVENNKFKKDIIVTISACFYYDPLITIQTIESLNFIEKLFSLWMEFLPTMNEGDKRKTLLAYTQILTVDPNNQPQVIIQNISTLIGKVIEISGEIDTKKEKQLFKNALEVNFDDEEDDLEDDDDKREEILNNLLAQAKTSTMGESNVNKANDHFDDDFLEEDEEDEDYDEFSDLVTSTPVDKLDEILFVKEAFHHILEINPTYYHEIMRLINDESKVKLESYIKNAENRKI